LIYAQKADFFRKFGLHHHEPRLSCGYEKFLSA
jgi:hypothetical protein